MNRILIASAALALLASPALRSQDAASEAAALPSPLDLRTALGYALDHNFSIRQAREVIRQQEGLIVQVKSQSIPNLTASGQYERNSSAISQTFPVSNGLWTVELKGTQTLYAGGGVRSSIANAKLQRDAAALDLQTTIDTALLDVRTKFYNVLLARDKIRVEEENVKLYEHQLEDTKNQFDTGTVSNFEVLRAKVSLANAQPNLITARNTYRIALEQLRQALGIPGGSAAHPALREVTGELSFTPVDFDPDAAILSAHEHRPELQKLHKLVQADEQSVVTAKSGYYPNLQAFGTYQWEGYSYQNSALGSSSLNGWTVGLQSSWAIFDGRSTRGKVLQARSVVEQARLSEATEDLEVDFEVRQALSSLEEAKELVAANVQAIDEATEALRLADAKLHAGSATQLDVLTSQVSLTQSKTDQLTANYNYLVALANVRRAIGLSDASVTP